MAEGGQKRDPINHRTKNQEDRHWRKEDQKREVVERREERHVARAHAIKAGKVARGDGLELDHVRPLSRGGSNAARNVRVTTEHANRVKGQSSQRNPKVIT
jgi:5-methylcytosine-specific restriction endonuclease McrA